jgi:iron complex outermembrane receptor protein
LIDEDGNYLGNDNPYQVDTESFSVFGQIEYDFTPQLTGIAGGALDHREEVRRLCDEFRGHVPGTTLRNGKPNIIDINPDNDTESIGTFSGSLDDDLWSAKLKLDWRPNDDLLLYASYNRGVKGAGFNAPLDITVGDGVTVIPDLEQETAFKEETLNAYEIGFKATLSNGLARLNGAVYYYDYEDFQAFKIMRQAGPAGGCAIPQQAPLQPDPRRGEHGERLHGGQCPRRLPIGRRSLGASGPRFQLHR